jgi:GH24 family phage-related lysozyme (muramidase)
VTDLLSFLVRHEGYVRHPYWPGGQSGVTLGNGYDLGYHTRDQFESDWGGLLEPFRRVLVPCLGKVGKPAQRLARTPEVRAVVVTAGLAAEVLSRALPVLEARTRGTFPGYDRLCRMGQVALCSLVFNRGASMLDAPGSDRRLEMRQLRDQVRLGDVAGGAASLRQMRRLWVGAGLDGLLRRREEEAQLLESCGDLQVT